MCLNFYTFYYLVNFHFIRNTWEIKKLFVFSICVDENERWCTVVIRTKKKWCFNFLLVKFFRGNPRNHKDSIFRFQTCFWIASCGFCATVLPQISDSCPFLTTLNPWTNFSPKNWRNIIFSSMVAKMYY